VRRLVVSGALPVVRISGKWRLDVEDLDKLISTLKVREGNLRAEGLSGQRHAPKATLPAGLAPLSPRSQRVVTER
jgi:hypothetical protein